MSEAAYLESLYIDDLIKPSYFKDTRKPTKVENGKILYKCTYCKEFKPKEMFYTDKRNPCGIRNRCKKCYHRKER